jgi:probable HAF family extracellular repeat protein
VVVLAAAPDGSCCGSHGASGHAATGRFDNGTGIHGFLDIGGSFTQIDVPGATETEALGINNTGQIVGQFLDRIFLFHGFLDTSGSFTQIDVPGAIQTSAFGINDAGQIVGVFNDSTGTTHGFLATPLSAVPEPSTLTLLAIGLTGIAISRRRRDSYLCDQS